MCEHLNTMLHQCGDWALLAVGSLILSSAINVAFMTANVVRVLKRFKDDEEQE